MYTLLEKNDLNDATSYYIEIVEDVFRRLGHDVKRIHSAKQVRDEDIVFVVKVTSMLRVLFRRPKQKIVLWIQGVTPEEALMADKCKLILYLRKFVLRLIERIVIPKAYFIFMVSREMLRHYQKIYGYCKRNYFIMPCFNQSLNRNSFVEHKYNVPSFVYSGSLSNWQCFDETVRIYKKIEKCLPESSFSVLTRETEKAKEILQLYNIQRYEIKYVPLEKLNEELEKYKYGFLLRENIEVNRVATPTKLNSYMAAGIIPIFSNVIVDFKEQMDNFKYIVEIDDINDVERSASRILQFEQNVKVNTSEIFNEYTRMFSQYYNKNLYVCRIYDKIQSMTTKE